jgi:hypothetical protein
MKYADITPTMRMLIGNREGLRRLGFSADDIYVQPARAVAFRGAWHGFLVLITEDGKFSIDCGPIASADSFGDEYVKVARAVNERKVSEDDLSRIYVESEAFTKGMDLLLALQAKGIRIPSAEADLLDILKRAYWNN